MNRKFAVATAIYAALAILTFFTLDGKIRIATWLFIRAFAFKTWLVVLKQRQD